jgi:hypothetical protein
LRLASNKAGHPLKAKKRYRCFWWAHKGYRNPTHSKAYRVLPESNVPLNSNAYFRDGPIDFDG